MRVMIISIQLLSVRIPNSLSSVVVVKTYIGGAINLILTGASLIDPSASPVSRASLIASIPILVCLCWMVEFSVSRDIGL